MRNHELSIPDVANQMADKKPPEISAAELRESAVVIEQEDPGFYREVERAVDMMRFSYGELDSDHPAQQYLDRIDP